MKNQIWYFSKSTLLCIVASFLPYITSTFNLNSRFIVFLVISLSLLTTTILFITNKKKASNVILPKTPNQESEFEIESTTTTTTSETGSNVDSVSSSSQSFEIFNNNNNNGSSAQSDYSISDYEDEDEDTLIEIKLPFVEVKQIHDFLPYEQQQQQVLMELLEDFNYNDNEDDNLIEIDISMGSIKASRFQIKA
ncbi:hypothetical protein ACFE04_022978 [Oxalis oulophora]